MENGLRIYAHTLIVMQGSHSDWKTWKNVGAFSSEGILICLEKSGNFFAWLCSAYLP